MQMVGRAGALFPGTFLCSNKADNRLPHLIQVDFGLLLEAS